MTNGEKGQKVKKFIKKISELTEDIFVLIAYATSECSDEPALTQVLSKHSLFEYTKKGHGKRLRPKFGSLVSESCVYMFKEFDKYKDRSRTQYTGSVDR